MQSVEVLTISCVDMDATEPWIAKVDTDLNNVLWLGQMRVWKGTSRWVVLWLLLSILTLLHSAALILAMYDVAAAKVQIPVLHGLNPPVHGWPVSQTLKLSSRMTCCL